MLAKTYSIFIANKWSYLFLVVAFEVLNNLAAIIGSSVSVVLLVLMTMFSRWLYRAAFFGVNFGVSNPDGVHNHATGFYVKTCLLGFISTVLALPLIFWWVAKMMNVKAISPTDVTVFFVTIFLSYAIVFSLVGTWPAAAIYRQNMSFWSALKRGVRYFPPVFGWILLGLSALGVLSVANYYFVTMLGVSNFLDAPRIFHPERLPGEIAGTFLWLLCMTLWAVVISHYYLKAESDKENLLQPAPVAA